MKIHYKTLKSPSMKLILDYISGNQSFNHFYLAGGTALSLQLGHRISEDLDYFTNVEFKSSLINSFKLELNPIHQFENSIEFVSKEVKVMFMFYGFGPYKEFVYANNTKLASIYDIGLSKLSCIQSRSTMKDLVDLYFIHKEFMSLDKLLSKFEETYTLESFNNYSSFKKILSKEDLEKDKMPVMLKKINFQEVYELVESKILEHVKGLVKN